MLDYRYAMGDGHSFNQNTAASPVHVPHDARYPISQQRIQLSDGFVPSFDRNTTAPTTQKTKDGISYRLPQQKSILPDDFEPSSSDIICGRGTQTHTHIGNKQFRATIAMNVERYAQAETKIAKSLVVLCVVNEIRKTSAFVKKDGKTGKWLELGDQFAKEKVGHALRDSIAGHNKKRSAGKEAKRSHKAQKKRARRKSAGVGSEDTDDDLCDEFFTNFVVDTFLGKKSDGDC